MQTIDNLICVWDLIHPQNEQASSTTLAPSTLGWFYILLTTASTKHSTNQKQWYEGENAHQTIAEVLPVKIYLVCREFIAILGFGCDSFGTNISLINMLLFIVAIFSSWKCWSIACIISNYKKYIDNLQPIYWKQLIRYNNIKLWKFPVKNLYYL